MTREAHDGAKTDAVLEKNVESLLVEASYDLPALDPEARARIRAALIADHATATAPRPRAPLYAIGLGLAAAAALAIAAGAIVGKDSPPTKDAGDLRTLADGSTVLLDKGAALDVLGPRHVRVRGAALLDVTPGKGAFTVDTAQGTIAVLGTRFVVDADPRKTIAAVIRGVVRLETGAGKVELRAGEQGVAEPGRPPVRGPAPRLSHLASWAKAARAKSEGKDARPVRNGTLFARQAGVRPGQVFSDQEYPLPMSQLTVDAVVDNQVARVALDQTFENPQPQELEGVYRFAIPSDAALQRFAMYVDGKLTESAVVERQRARRIYEELVYRRIDPGLLEWAGAGRLSLRIYPLRAQADKRILLAYTQSLPRLYDDWTMTVPLPEVDGTVDDVVFNVRVKGCATCELHSPSHEVAVTKDGADAIVKYHARGERIGDSLVLVARDTSTDTRVATHASGDHSYLVVRARPDLATGRVADHRPRTWVVLDDVSASRGVAERRAQADVIDRMLREIDEGDRVAVLTMDSILRELGPLVRADAIDAKAVRAFLTSDEVGGVGATDLARGLERATAILAGVDPRDAFVVYVGDGVVTAGSEWKLAGLREKIAGKATFVGVGIGDGVDTPTLAALADATGGLVYTMDLADDLRWRTFDLVASLYTARVTGLGVSLVNGRGQAIAAATYLRAGQLGDGEELELVARVPRGADVAAVEVTGTRDGAPWESRIEIAAARGAGGDTGYLPRLWAQRHVAARLLAKEDDVDVPPCVVGQPCKTEEQVKSEHREAIRHEVVELGKKFFLLSRHTSLLVLEDDAMYAKYDVTKGAGDTWAPYALPATVKVKEVAAANAGLPNVSPDAILVRTPLQKFQSYPMVLRGTFGGAGNWQFRAGLDAGGGLTRWGDGDGRLVLTAALRAAEAGEGELAVTSMPVGATVVTDSSSSVAVPQGGGPVNGQPVSGVGTAVQLETAGFDDPNRGPTVPADSQQAATKFVDSVDLEAREEDGDDGGEMARNEVAQAAITSGEMMNQRDAWMVGHGSGSGQGQGRAGWFAADRSSRISGNAHFWSPAGLAYPIALHYAGDPRLDDLSEHVPALFPGPIDASIGELEAAAGGKTGSVDADARTLIGAARTALPIGVYRLGDGPSIAVGPGGTLAWRHVDDSGLEELARWDGARLRRAYPELGLEVARDLGERSPAVALTVMPLLVAPADDLARWFVVTARGRTLYLAAAKDPTQVLFTIELDDKHRVIAIKTAAGDELVSVTWGAQGPVSAKLGGKATSIGFTTAADPVAIPPDLAVVSLPLPQLARAQTAAQAAVAGTPAWREAQRRVLAAAAAVQDVGAARAAFEALLDNGGVLLGDVVLAGVGLATGPQPLFDRAVASFGTGATALPPAVRYLAASRVYRAKAAPDVLVPGSDAGVVGAVWRYRQVLALIAADKRLAAVTALEAMGDRAPELQLIAASMIGQQWSWPAALMGRAWDAVADGDLRNIARYEAARAFTNRGDYAAAADRFAALLADVDLTARPAPVDYLVQTAMYNSPRGQAGFEMAWRGYSTRVIADAGVDHVIALAYAATQVGRTADADAALGRVIELVGTDRAGLMEALGLAFALGQVERATALLPTLLAGDPDPEVLRIASQVATAQGRSGEAADYLEQAMQKAEGPTPLASVRADYAQLIALRGRIAQLSIGQAKEDAVGALLGTVRRWREIDPANPQIDALAGQMLLQVGKTEEALRQLATAIEREPMEGTGWILVADTLERNGKYSEAVDTWRQAVVIDQTNPGPRLRLAQLYYAMGMSDEGDQVVRDARGRKWHDRFANDVWQLDSLARQRGVKN